MTHVDILAEMEEIVVVVIDKPVLSAGRGKEGPVGAHTPSHLGVNLQFI